MRGLILIIVWLLATPAAAQLASVESFGRLPAVADAAISPDGSMVALAMSQGDREFVNVVNLDDRRSVFAANVPDHTRLRGVNWIDNGRVSFLISRTFAPHQVLPAGWQFRGRPRRVDYWRTGAIDLATQEVRLLSTSDESEWMDSGAQLIAPIQGEPDFGRMIGTGVRAERLSVYSIDLNSGRARPISTLGVTNDTIHFILDERGAVVARVDSDRRTNRWGLFVYEGGQPRLISEDISETGAPPAIVGLTRDARLAMIDDGQNGLYRLVALNMRDGSAEVIFERPEAEVISGIIDPWHRRVEGVVWGDGAQHFFEAPLQNAYARLNEVFDGGGAAIVSWSQDRSRLLVYADRGLDGGGYYLFEPAADRLTTIAMRYPDIRGGGERQSIYYRARDGVRIPAYLTLPADVAERRGMPLVVLVHGGPHGSRDSIGFDYWASFLASRGYAVLQANYRGSGGYGRAWEEAGYRQWGGLMQTDVDDGVDALRRAGLIDPSRVCIVGASYGGYAALAGATLTPDLYSCAVSVAGVSDLPEFLRTFEAEHGSDGIGGDFWRRSIGARDEDRARIREVSPVFLADRVQIPILLMHGTNDTVVPIEQSRRMREALRAVGKNVQYVELTGDDHWLSDATTRIQVLSEIEIFLARELAPR